MEMKVLFSQQRVFNFLNFMKEMQNLTNATLRVVWPCYLLLKIRKITEKIGFQFCKLRYFYRGK